MDATATFTNKYTHRYLMVNNILTQPIILAGWLIAITKVYHDLYPAYAQSGLCMTIREYMTS